MKPGFIYDEFDQLIEAEGEKFTYDALGRRIEKLKISELSVEQVLSQYHGFEGDLVEMLLIKGDEEEQKEVIKKCQIFYSIPKHVVLFVVSYDNSLPKFLKATARFVGYDIGTCEEGKKIYSSVFNEILFGNVPELISQQNILNQNRLLPDILSAEKYIALHGMLASRGEDVEDYEKLAIYEIWQYSTTSLDLRSY
jgi:hypothetical protein